MERADRPQPSLWGLVLAAGESRRMGRLKPLLPLGPETLLQNVLRSLKAPGLLEGIVVVLGYRAQEIAPTLFQYDVVLLENPRYTEGMFQSLKVGVEWLLPRAEAILLALGDQPFVRPETISLLIQKWREQQKGIIQPAYANRRGHPILLDLRRYGPLILQYQGEGGLRQLLHQYSEDRLIVKVEDPAILKDLDYPEDYEALLRQINPPSNG